MVKPPQRDFDVIARLDDRVWTADLALELMPANNGPRTEVYRGSVVATPRHGRSTAPRPSSS